MQAMEQGSGPDCREAQHWDLGSSKHLRVQTGTMLRGVLKQALQVRLAA